MGMIDIIGFVASGLLFISISRDSLKSLRWIGLAATLVFLLQSSMMVWQNSVGYSLVFTNLITIGIYAYNIWKDYKNGQK